MSGTESLGPPPPGGPSNWRAWLDKARNDLLNIENNLASERIPWDTVCFHAQQAAEKALKSLLVYKGETPQRTHDLVALLWRCVALEPALSTLEPDCRLLSAYGVASRYPDDVFTPNESDALRLVASAKALLVRVLHYLPASADESGDSDNERSGDLPP